MHTVFSFILFFIELIDITPSKGSISTSFKEKFLFIAISTISCKLYEHINISFFFGYFIFKYSKTKIKLERHIPVKNINFLFSFFLSSASIFNFDFG